MHLMIKASFLLISYNRLPAGVGSKQILLTNKFVAVSRQNLHLTDFEQLLQAYAGNTLRTCIARKYHIY